MPKFSPWLRAAPVCWLLSAAWAVAQQNAAPAEREAARKALDDVKTTLVYVQKRVPCAEEAAALVALERRFTAAETAPDLLDMAEAAAKLRRRILFAHPALAFNDLLFVERDIIGGDYYNGELAMDQCFGHNARKGGGLYLLKNFKAEAPELIDVVRGLAVPSGTNTGMPLSEGTFMSPDLGYDGHSIVFAWSSGGREKWKPENRFNLFRVDVDGTHLARLSDGDFDDFDPCWLPDGGIAFISTRRGGFGRCHPRPVPTYTLFGMQADGSGIRCLSYHETNEWQPSVDHNGMLIYTRWDYIDRDAMIAIHPWTCTPDGRNPRAVHGNYPLPLTTMSGAGWPDGRTLRPQCEHGLRAIPNSDKYVAVATPHHNESYGSLILIDPHANDDGQMSQVRRLTPEVKFPEIEKGELAYGTPWPLSEDLYLCNYKGSLCVVYFPESKGMLEPLYIKKSLRPVDPIPVQSRSKPHVIPTPTTPLAAPATGLLYVQNVYTTDEFGRLPEGTKITRLRIVQVFPKTTEREDQPRISRFTESLVRASLGTVPVEPDGSVYCEVPAAKEIYFQLLDERGMAVQSMRSGTFLHAGELLSCTGCHESNAQAALPLQVPAALGRRPSQLKPELTGMADLDPCETVNYYRLVKPVFDAKCASCHQAAGKGPDMSYASLGAYLSGFEGKWGTLHGAKRFGGSRTLAGQCGARASELFAGGYLTGTSTTCRGKPQLTDAELRRITLWLDLNSNELGAYHDVDAQRQGQRVAPLID
jgi:cytochrome c553